MGYRPMDADPRDYRAMDDQNPNSLPLRKPRITEQICDHLGSESRYEIREYTEDHLEAGCEDQDHCDLFGKKGCPVTSSIELNQGICEDCGETIANCRCGWPDLTSKG